MSTARLFISQHALSELLDAEACSLEGNVLHIPGDEGGEGASFSLVTAVRFLGVEAGEDEVQWLDRVLDVETLHAHGAEHVGESVLLGETAYHVQEGFLGSPRGTPPHTDLSAVRKWWERRSSETRDVS